MFTLTIEREKLKKALDRVCGIVEKRVATSAGETSSLVRFSIVNGALELLTADGETEIKSIAQCNSEVDGMVSVSAKIVHDIVQRLPEKTDIKISPEGNSNRLELRAARSKYQLATMNESSGGLWDSVTIEKDENAQSVIIDAAELKRIFDKIKFAIFQDSSRPYLHGVYIHPVEFDGKHFLRGVATDGHRLAYSQAELKESSNNIISGIIPRKVVHEASRLLSDIQGNVTLNISENCIGIETENFNLISRLVAGDFPDYQRIIPSNLTFKASLNRKELISAIERMRLISNTIRFKFSTTEAGKSLVLETQDNDTGNAIEEINADFSDGDMIVGFNGQYVSEIANQCEADNIEFHLGDANGATKVVDAENSNMMFIIMPMRV